MAMSKRARDEKTVVIYFGSPGSFSEDAAVKYFGLQGINKMNELDARPSSNLNELFKAVVDGTCNYAVVPLENNTSGLLQDVLHKLLGVPSLHIVGEVLVSEEHCLCVQPGTKLTDIRTVISHPHLLMQCEDILGALESDNGGNGIARQTTFDSAGACRLIDSPSKAAISSRRAGMVAGLEELALPCKRVDLARETRYIVLSTTANSSHGGSGVRCSVSFTLRNQVNLRRPNLDPALLLPAHPDHQPHMHSYYLPCLPTDYRREPSSRRSLVSLFATLILQGSTLFLSSSPAIMAPQPRPTGGTVDS